MKVPAGWSSHTNFRGTFIYRTASKATGFRPGFVNSVSVYPEPFGDGFCVEFTDGYKVQNLPVAADLDSAIAKAEFALEFGAGGGLVSDGTNGFTSYFRPN